MADSQDDTTLKAGSNQVDNSVDMAYLIRQSNLIEGYDDAEFDRVSLWAWEWLLTQPALALTNDIICQLQSLIVRPQTDLEPKYRGSFRDIPVWVGSHEGVKPELIPRKMNYLLQTYTFIHPHTWHVEFEKVHPFVDGNGRTGRMLMWWTQHHRAEPATVILNEKKQDYYKWFKADEALNDLVASGLNSDTAQANPPLSAPTNTDELDTEQQISRILWAVYEAGQYDAKKLRSSNVPVQGATKEIAHLIAQKQIEELERLSLNQATTSNGIDDVQVTLDYLVKRQAQLKGGK